MAESASNQQNTLRQLLAKFQVAALEELDDEQRLHKPVETESFYEIQLQQKGLSTPLAVVENLGQLRTLLGGVLTPPERECLVTAAYLLTGLKDRDRFHTANEMREFAQDENYGDVADVVHALWPIGFRSCAAIHRAARQDQSALERLVGSNVPSRRHSYLRRFARTYSDMENLASILAEPLPVPDMDTTSTSASHSDVGRDKHPKSVQLWQDCDEEVLRHKQTKKRTEPRFISNRLGVDRGPAMEYSVSRVFESEIGSILNAGIEHWKRKGYLAEEKKVYARWEPQGTDVQTDAEARETARAAGQHGSDDASREALERSNAARAQGAIQRRVKRGRFFFDQYLRKVNPSPITGHRDGLSVVVLKRVERLRCDTGEEDVEWTEIEDAPDFVALWNCPKNPNTPSLQTNVIGAIEQWNDYASSLGIRYGLIFTHMWSWAICADGLNNIKISRAYRFDAEAPTVLEVADFITHKALSEEDGICPRWEPLKDHPPSVRVVDRSGGPANRTRSVASAQQLPSGAGAGVTSGGAGAEGPSAGAGVEGPSDSDQDADLLGSPQSVLPGITRSEHDMAKRLAQAAAAFERSSVMGVLGRGALGEVFWGRMPCGRKVALKIAFSGSREEDMLRSEAAAYLALQHLWNSGVPELLLAGDLCALGGGYGLGTSVLSGRPLRTGDAELLPAAVALLVQIHSKGVIHNDLRADNFVVMEPDISMGPPDRKIFLLDFSHSHFDISEDAQLSEMSNLHILFQSL